MRLQNQLEALLEEAHIKLSSLVSDLLGASGRRMLKALAEGEIDPLALAALGDKRLHATPAELRDALGACTELNPVYRRLVRMALEELQLIEQQIGQLDQEIASLLRQHQDAVERLAEVPGLGVDSAQQIIAEVGATGDLPRSEESRVVGGSMPRRGRKRGRELQQTLAQRQPPDAPHSESSCRCCRQTQRKHLRDPLCRLVPRLGHNKTIGAIAHRLCQLIWILLHKGVRYEERGPAVCEKSKRVRTLRMIRTLRNLGYRVEPLQNPA